MSEWISVNDRLPTETGTYLVNVHQKIEDEVGDSVLLAWYNMERPICVPENISWILLNEFYHLSDQLREYITHWMPIPEPPDEPVGNPDKLNQDHQRALLENVLIPFAGWLLGFCDDCNDDTADTCKDCQFSDLCQRGLYPSKIASAIEEIADGLNKF